jgi:hypothetical protein
MRNELIPSRGDVRLLDERLPAMYHRYWKYAKNKRIFVILFYIPMPIHF